MLSAFPLRLFLLLGVFLHLPLIKAKDLSILLQLQCRTKLAQTESDKILSENVALFRSRLNEAKNKNAASKLEILDELTKNPPLVEAVSNGDYEASKLVFDVCTHNGNLPFAEQALSLLKKLSGPAVNLARMQIKRDLPPPGLEKAAAFPPDAFLDSTLSDKAKKTLLRFASRAINLNPQTLTRRIFAFMSENLSLKRDEKINFLDHLIATYQEFQKKHEDLLDTKFYSKKLNDASGNIIYCSHHCSFYFVIDNEGRFYTARSHLNVHHDSEAEVIRNWKDTALFIYQAGTAAPIKEPQTL